MLLGTFSNEEQGLYVTAAFLAALAVGGLGMLAVLPMLRRAKLMDVPNARSSHSHPVLRGGGVAIVLGVLAGAAVGAVEGHIDSSSAAVLSGMIILAAVGLVDDVRSLPSLFRLGSQTLVAGCVVVFLADLGDQPVMWWAVVAFAVGYVSYVNAYNFMDGINGISALTALLVGGWYAWLGYRFQIDSVAILGGSLAGAALGFLPWNAPRARVFMGDVGSYAVGALIVGIGTVACIQGVAPVLLVAPLLIYFVDCGWTLVGRAARRKPVLRAHREHVYQRVTDQGSSHFAVALMVFFFGAAACAIAWGLPTPAPYAGGASFMLLSGAYLAVPRVRDFTRRTGLGSVVRRDGKEVMSDTGKANAS